MKTMVRKAGIAALIAVCGAAVSGLSCGIVDGANAVSKEVSGEYNFYPGSGYYPSGTSETYVWQTPEGSGIEGFQTYADGSLIESSADKSLQNHLEVTSGALNSLYISGTNEYRRAVTNTHNFRMLVQGLYNGQRVKWTDQALRVRFYVDEWQDTTEEWQGVHLFARYRTENNLYVASLRRDGTVFIKEKVNGTYATLDDGVFADQNGNPRSFDTKRWYTLTLTAVGNRLRFYIDGVLQLEATDGSFSWGTMGLRTDYADVYLDDMKMYDDLSGL